MSEKIIGSAEIEYIVKDVLSGEDLQASLEFIAFLRENKMTPGKTSNNGWKISSKGCVVCYLWIDSSMGTLSINPFIGEYEHNSLADDLKQIVLSKKKQGTACEICHVISGNDYNCSYKIKTVFGKNYSDACARSITFINPNAKEYECVKKLLELRKNTIKNGNLLPTSPKNYA